MQGVTRAVKVTVSRSAGTTTLASNNAIEPPMPSSRVESRPGSPVRARPADSPSRNTSTLETPPGASARPWILVGPCGTSSSSTNRPSPTSVSEKVPDMKGTLRPGSSADSPGFGPSTTWTTSSTRSPATSWRSISVVKPAIDEPGRSGKRSPTSGRGTSRWQPPSTSPLTAISTPSTSRRRWVTHPPTTVRCRRSTSPRAGTSSEPTSPWTCFLPISLLASRTNVPPRKCWPHWSDAIKASTG